jgi:hypothetical protein
MTRDRVDALNERVREIKTAVECLDKVQLRVRRQLETVEAAVDGSTIPGSPSILPQMLADSTSSETEHSEATDEEVAAAVRAFEEDFRKDGERGVQ